LIILLEKTIREGIMDSNVEVASVVANGMAMLHNQTNDVQNSIIEGLESDIDYWRERALKAEDRLTSAYENLQTMVFGD